MKHAGLCGVFMLIILILSACQPTVGNPVEGDETAPLVGAETGEQSTLESENMSEEAGQNPEDESGAEKDIAALQAGLLSSLAIPAEITVLKETELECPDPSERGGIITERYDNGDGDRLAYKNEGRDKILQKIAELLPKDETPWPLWSGLKGPEEYIALYVYGANADGVLQWGDRFLEMEESFGYKGTPLVEIWLEDIDGDWVQELCVKGMESSLAVYKKEGEEIVKYYLPWLSREVKRCFGVQRQEDGFLVYTHDSAYKIYAEDLEYGMEHYSEEYGFDDGHFLGTSSYSTFMGVCCLVGWANNKVFSTPIIGLWGELRLEDGVFIWEKLFLKPLS